MDGSDDELEAYRRGIAKREPTITHFIDPPFQIRVEGDVVHVDAPCVVTPRMTTELLRFSLSGPAAMVLKDALNLITFVEVPDAPGNQYQ